MTRTNEVFEVVGLPMAGEVENGATGAGAAPGGSGTGGSVVEPSPGPTPSPAATPTPTPDGGGEAPDPFNFNDILSGNGEENEGGALVVPPVAAPAKPAAVEAKPPVPPVPAPGTPAAPTEVKPGAAPTPPVAPQEAAPGPQGVQTPALSPAEPAQLAQAMRESEAAILAHVADTMFKLSDEEVRELEADATIAIPKYLAKVFVKSQQNTLSLLAQSVPQMIQTYMRVTKANDDNADKFYSRWPDINKAEHGDLVNRLGVTYRRLNPTATLDQMVEELGPFVMMQAKIVPGAPRPAGTVPAAKPPGNGVKPPQPSPFAPAMPGAVAATLAGSEDDSPWSILDPSKET